jgi:hypothetical protein
MDRQDLELGPLSSTAVPKPEPQSPPPAKGFSAVASKIAYDPDKTTTIYRRFDKLSSRDLLFYLAELAELEEQQNEYDEADRLAKDQISIACQRDWSEFMKNAREEGRTRERKKMELVMRIRENLEKYREAYLKRIWNERKY